MNEAMAEAVDEKTINEARHNLFNVRRRLEDIIYNTDLAVTPETSPEKLARINNIILELEKSAINLGAVITESEEDERIELTDEQRQQLREAREEKIREKKKEKKSAKK